MDEPGLIDGLEGLAEPALTKFLQQAGTAPAA
jgi:hypothetical protein